MQASCVLVEARAVNKANKGEEVDKHRLWTDTVDIWSDWTLLYVQYYHTTMSRKTEVELHFIIIMILEYYTVLCVVYFFSLFVFHF